MDAPPKEQRTIDAARLNSAKEENKEKCKIHALQFDIFLLAPPHLFFFFSGGDLDVNNRVWSSDPMPSMKQLGPSIRKKKGLPAIEESIVLIGQMVTRSRSRLNTLSSERSLTALSERLIGDPCFVGRGQKNINLKSW